MFCSSAGIILSTLSYCCCIDRRPLETFIFTSITDLKDGKIFIWKRQRKAEITKNNKKLNKSNKHRHSGIELSDSGW